jgi:hypothetical protein
VKIKKLFKYFLPGIITFALTGILFFNSGVKQNVYSFPEYKYQTGSGVGKDSASSGSDGPIIVYEDGKIINYSVYPSGTSFVISKKYITGSDTLSCFIDETNRKFSFKLKDTVVTEKDIYELPERMLIISDIHGKFKGLEMILTGAGVLDDNLNWIFGNGHLVLDGDFFDRGNNATECLWLIYKLESEAEMQGGKVHFILGNHELMNLKENYKYVSNKYFKIADTLKLDYKKWYAPNTELGKWLRSKNSIEKIGDYLFLHAGISKDFPKGVYSITDINNNIRSTIDRIYQSGEISGDIFIGRESPVWYRGIAEEKEVQEEVEKTLLSFGASKMILGHTIIDSIKYLYNKKIILINVDHQVNTDNGKMFALWFENNKFSIVDNKGNKTNLK